MYVKPDFIKVNVNVKDTFASYEPCEGVWDGIWSMFTTSGQQSCKDDYVEGASMTYNGATTCYITFQVIHS